MANWTASAIQRRAPGVYDNSSGKFILSPLPLLEKEKLDDLKVLVQAPMPPNKALALSRYLCVAPLLERSTDVLPVNLEEVTAKARLDLTTAIADYLSAKALASFEASIDSSVEDQLAKQQLTADSLDKRLENTFQSFRDGFAQLEAERVNLTDKVTEMVTTLALSEDDLRQKLTNFEAAIRQELGLDRARENWSKRYTEARTSFKNTSILLSGMIAVPFVTAFLAGPAVVRFVNNFDLAVLLGAGGSGAVFGHFLTRLVVISVPLFAYLWGLRVVIRYFTRSMTLKDDARMRETMLDTYFMLVEAGRADEASRPIILNALFRPAPGHSTEGTEPPEMAAYLESIAKMGRP